MANSRKLIVEVVGDASKLDRTFKQVESRSQKFGRKLQGAGVPGGGLLGSVGKGGLIGAGAAAGAAVAVKAISSVIAKAKEAQIAEVQLDQAFAASGVSAAKFGKKAEAAIQRVSKQAAIDDEEVSGVFANLLRSTGDFEKATKGAALAANIARARNISLAAAGKAVERAYNGSDAALKRVGVSVPKVSTRYDALKEKVKKLTDQMHAAKGPLKEQLKAQIEAAKLGADRAKQLDKEESAQSAITKAQRQFAGAAERYGKTAAGAQEKYQVALENVQERIGAKLLPLQTKLAEKAVEFLDWADANWPRFARAIQRAYTTAKPFIDQTVGAVKGIANVIAGVVKTIDAIRHGDWSKAWKGIKQVAVDGVAGIAKSIATLPLKIASAVGGAALNAIRRAIERALDAIIRPLNDTIGGINRVSPFKDIPKIPLFSSGTRPAAAGPVGPVGTRSTQGVVQTTLVVDGHTMNRALAPYRRADARRNPSQRRGPNAGLIVY